MRRNLRFALLAAVFGASAAGLGYALHSWMRSTAIEAPSVATDFKLPDLAGKHNISTVDVILLILPNNCNQ